MLSLFFRAVLGIERIFHFETLRDLGFALLTGGSRPLSRSRLGGLVRAVSTPAAKAFARATERLGKLAGQVVTFSLDEHVVARFTRKFRIAKGYHTIRNKHMRSEKLFFLHWPAQRRFLLLLATRARARFPEIGALALAAPAGPRWRAAPPAACSGGHWARPRQCRWTVLGVCTMHQGRLRAAGSSPPRPLAPPCDAVPLRRMPRQLRQQAVVWCAAPSVR